MAIKLNLTRYEQDPACCAIAAIASIANYYNPDWDYKNIKWVSESVLDSEITEGLWTGEIGKLLNFIGFREVCIVSSDLGYLDYSWAKLSKTHLVEKLYEMSKANSDVRDSSKVVANFLEQKEFNNKLIIDHCFDKHIRKALNQKKPVIIGLNWTKLFRYIKKNQKKKQDDINGDSELHAVVVCGYDKKGVFIIDSHHECYKYRLRKYRNGHYKIGWEELMAVMAAEGDIAIPLCYDPQISKYELT